MEVGCVEWDEGCRLEHGEQCRGGGDTPVNGSVVDEDDIGFGDGMGTGSSEWEVQHVEQALFEEPFPTVGGHGGPLTMEEVEAMLD